ncbi:EVE domain-containing protein [Bradymonadaceae bacterium TMQ3]|uniref:EVE domain-containing protein n=1 Tax=Lujinxingia sediminis TaxID=2480984 RepID=A0ABY0CPQ6_9DELT|nr:EVE domain-containing protein [Lujinxingia sediminis]RDV37129.1 EVE domain-containing protein [Bradymonadaceae bacterium TMQ3]RVU42427.1 EVE domain-containing protein [Lujinxingia sediminis]TXC74627.1 EVE domain-containing protein [Bradymonadales bacterium TMQ1]
MRYWLVKSEPEVFSLDDLKDKKVSPWDGVRNYQARNFMRDEMGVGDPVLFYHSRERPPAVVGLAEVVSEPYPDPTQYDPASPYFDPKATESKPRWWLVDLGYVRHFPQKVSLEQIKATEALQEMMLVKRSRLSVMPVAQAHAERILTMAGEAP